MKNKYGIMENIIQVNLKIIYQMEKELNIIKMEKFNTKEILLMENLKEMENLFMMTVIISQVNLKMV